MLNKCLKSTQIANTILCKKNKFLFKIANWLSELNSDDFYLVYFSIYSKWNWSRNFSIRKKNSKKACLMHLKTLNDFSNIFTTNFRFFLLLILPIWCVYVPFIRCTVKLCRKKKVFFSKLKKTTTNQMVCCFSAAGRR